MTTSVNTISEIVKWAEGLPEWQSDVLRRLFINGELSEAEKQEVIDIAKNSAGIVLKPLPPVAVPFTAVHAPGQTTSTDVTYLKTIRDVKHVNALAGNQTITIGGKGITVIYGDNGSGKSGYSRLLKRACRARHTEEILPNVHEISSSACVSEATFDIQEGISGVEESLIWREGDTTPEKLSQVAVFDTHCARVFVDEANTVSFIPYGLDVFPKLASLFDELKSKFTVERTQLQRCDEILLDLQGEHEAGKLISSLSSKTDKATLEKLSTISESEQEEFSKLDVVVKELQANDPQKQAIAIRRTKMRIDQYRKQLQSSFKLLDKEAVSGLQTTWETAKTKAEVAKLASSEQFAGEPLNGVGSDAWREMYNHAREYSVTEAYPTKEFPVTDDESNCPLCMQKLSSDAKDRMNRFEKYVGDKTEKEAADAKKELINIFKPIKELATPEADETLLSEIHDIDNDIRKLITDTEKLTREVKETIIKAVKNGGWELVTECDKGILLNLKTIIDDLEEEAKGKDKLVNPEKRKKVIQKYEELTARKKLSAHKILILEHIERFKKADCLTKIIDSLNSRAVSTKASQLSQLVLTSELKSSIDKELSTLSINHIELGLKPSSPKGKTKHQLTMVDTNNSSKLTKILSEGEQRVIAIASFLGELGLSPIKTGIVFDDPVSSLDHKWSERIANRLVVEGADRQVIIFTHNISFLLALYKYAAKHQVEITSQSLHRILKISGQCDSELPWAARNASKRNDKLHEIAQKARAAFKVDPDGEEYKTIHDKFNSRLRSTWERTVEEKLLNGVVMRFDSGVSTQLLNGVVVDDEDYRDVYHAMSGSSEGIDAHDHAGSQHDQLKNPDEIEAELAKLKKFKSNISKKQDEAIARRKQSVKAPTHNAVE